MTRFRNIQELLDRFDSMSKRIDDLENENKELRKELTELKIENAELRSLLNKNSTNSNKPPSSDGYKKKPAFAKNKSNKQGGQKDHKGRTLHQIEHPDKVLECPPENCTCGHEFEKDEFILAEKRQVFDLPQPKLEVTEYRILKACCPNCGLTHKGVAPEGVNAPVQYGNGVKAYAVLLNVHFTLPFKKIQLLFGDLFGYSINESTICSADLQCYEKLGPSEEIIKSMVAASAVAHADETGMRVAGRLAWLHTATNTFFTYLFIHQKRGLEALKSDKSILDKIAGWLVHDCWSSYFSFEKIKHAICGAHILRELEGLVENGHSKWAKTFKVFLLSVYEMPFPERLRLQHTIRKRYVQICTIGEKLEPEAQKISGKRGRYKRTKARNLLERLIREQESLLAFAFNEQVPFTNNLAERDIRPAKVKMKISNSFRTFQGAEIYARIEGFISTARKQNRHVFSELRNTFDGYNFIVDEIGR